MISDSEKLTYVGMFVLKLLDLRPEDGGLDIPVNLPHTLAPFEPVLEQLAIEGMIEVDRKRGLWQLTPRGDGYLGALVDEAEALIDEFDEAETEDMIAVLRRRNLDPLRARFLWGWYQGEFDDPVLYQQRRGITPVEHDWATFLLSDEFFEDLARDLIPYLPN